MSAPVIALIDDDEVFQLTSSRMLRAINPDVTVKQFANGGVALSFFAEQAENAEELPDIILLDINMPYVDGWMFLVRSLFFSLDFFSNSSDRESVPSTVEFITIF